MRLLKTRSLAALAAAVLLILVVGVALIYAARPQALDAVVYTPPTPIPTGAAATAAATASASDRVAPDVANRSLADRLRETGRADVAICLYVDASTGLSADAAKIALQDSIDALVQQGYSVLGVRRVAPCTEAPYFLRTNTVHPQNSGSGPVGPEVRVTAPSPILLFVAVTTPARINAIFGGLTSRRGDEEFICSGGNCASVTGSIYADPTAFADAVIRQMLVLKGLGLLGR